MRLLHNGLFIRFIGYLYFLVAQIRKQCICVGIAGSEGDVEGLEIFYVFLSKCFNDHALTVDSMQTSEQF